MGSQNDNSVDSYHHNHEHLSAQAMADAAYTEAVQQVASSSGRGGAAVKRPLMDVSDNCAATNKSNIGRNYHNNNINNNNINNNITIHNDDDRKNQVNTQQHLQRVHIEKEISENLVKKNMKVTFQCIQSTLSLVAGSEQSLTTENNTTDKTWIYDKEAIQAFEKICSNLTAELVTVTEAALECQKAFEAKTTEIEKLKEELHLARLELGHLRACDEQNRTAIGNLLHESVQAASQVRMLTQARMDASHAQAELSVMSRKHEESQSNCDELSRKVQLLEEELQYVKSKLSNTVADKIRIQREQRAALSLVRNQVEQSDNTDGEVHFYKEKLQEVKSNEQRLKAKLVEKDRELEKIRIQIKRNFTAHGGPYSPLKSSSSKHFKNIP